MAFAQLTYRESLRDIEVCLQGHAQRARGSARRGAVGGTDPGLPANQAPAQTGRDAVCAHEAGTEDGSPESAWAEGRSGRVPVDGDGAKSQTHGQIP